MAGAGKKTFTAGETLTASDVNTYLMEQSVMVFGGTAARSSAIPTPSEGMTTYRTDTQQIESYDGAEWRGMSGMQLVKKQTVGTGVSSVTVTSAFSATYEDYKILIVGGTSSQTTGASMQLGSSTSAYKYTLNYVSYGGANTILTSASASSFVYAGVCVTTEGLLMNLDIKAPFLTKKTNVSGFYTGLGESGTFIGIQDSATSYTAFTITPQGGTLTGGTIYVYGYGT